MLNILLVEDDPGLARGTQVNLELEGYKVFHAANCEQARRINFAQKLHLVLLDLGLPDQHGFVFLKELRENGSKLPVIILTAQTDENSVVTGLQLGANDYVRKPFGQRELVARIKSLLRQSQLQEDQLRYEDLLVLVDRRTIKYKDKSLELNRREFDILLHFVRHAETIVSRESLLNAMDRDGEIFDRTIDSHISHLRSRLKKSGIDSIKISSVYGVGYRLEKSTETSE